MDTLALLCNLHADGPATLQRLRRAGCESLGALRRLDPSELAEQLEWNERSAERFLREAALLAERVEDVEAGLREPEEEFELESVLVGELDGEDDEGEDEGEEEGEEEEFEQEEESSYAPPPARVEAVLGAWRELDRVAPPSEPAEFVLPRPAPLPDRVLTDADLDGPGGRLRARLGELGVRTLRELAGARELELARALPLGFTRLKRLQHAARRALERLVEESVRPPAPAAFEAFSPPAAEPFETAGPFA